MSPDPSVPAAMAQGWPMLRLLALALLLAALPLGWWAWRHRRAPTRARLAALTALTLFLTFDLIVFGAFTRLTDSGLGCPDWPGCYGHASPVGARADIHLAQAERPQGPVTHAKAWIEMVHRYLAMVVGALILVAAAAGWKARRALPHSPWWGLATLAWVLVQGLFGKYTVTLKLYPAIVTLHLLGAQLLLILLVAQHESFRDRPARWAGLRPSAVAAVLGILLLQIALGGWVSTNYAVLACDGFPSCNGRWWPADAGALRDGFVLLRPLGQLPDGRLLPFEALVAIHWVHRVFAVVAAVAVGGLALALWRSGAGQARRLAVALAAVLLLQVATGVSNVVLDWPIAAALAHSAGAAVLVFLVTSVWLRLCWSRAGRPATVPPGLSPQQPTQAPQARGALCP